MAKAFDDKQVQRAKDLIENGEAALESAMDSIASVYKSLWVLNQTEQVDLLGESWSLANEALKTLRDAESIPFPTDAHGGDDK